MSSSAELQREREVQGYFQSWQIAQGSSLKVARSVDSISAPSQINDAHTPQPSSDKALSAFAQLAVFRLNVKRCMVSLIDSSNQYILAEATRNLRLGSLEEEPGANTTGDKKDSKIAEYNSDLWLGTSILSRPEAVCEHCLHNTCTGRDPDGKTYTTSGLIVPDCRLDDRFKSRVYVQSEPGVRFYAGVPIFSRKGYKVGAYAVSDEQPRDGLSIEDVKFMQSVAQAITEHLEWARDRVDRFKGERIVRGLATFIEGCSSDDPILSKEDQPQRPSIKRPPGMTITATRRSSLHNTMRKVDPDSNQRSQKATSPPRKHKPQTDGLSRMYHRAADNLRSAILADGVVLFGATASNVQHRTRAVQVGQGGATNADGLRTQVAAEADTFSTESSDSETSPLSRPCKLLAYSLADKGKPLDLEQGPSFSIGTLEKYFSLFPKGKTFTFTEEGAGLSSDDDSASDGSPAPAGGRSKRRKEKIDHKELLKKIPGAKAVVFLPLFDYVEDKLVGGCFLWTSVPGRMMNLDEDLSYLRAFGNSITSQVGRINTRKNEAAKTTFIASMSHELRSPLHGILGAAEFLKDAVTDSYEAGLVNSIATCGKTLLDTLNHVLDFSKINNLGSGHLRKGAKHNKVISLSSDSMESLNMTASVDLSILVEEVVDAVATGHNFKRLPRKQQDDVILGGKDSQGAPEPGTDLPVSILLDVSPRASWMVKTQPGALRRIVMNLFGNALKYTALGFVLVSVRAQEISGDSRIDVLIRVTDTGKGMSEDFQQNRLFVPFSQEDSFQPGTGLGLSIVKQIVDSLGGTLEVKSEQDKGTEIEVRLRLEPVPQENPKPEEPMASMVKQLRGRSLVLLEASEDFHSRTITKQVEVRNEALMEIFSSWFNMKAAREVDTDVPNADFYLYCEPPSAKTLEKRFEETAIDGRRNKKAPIIIISLNEEEAAKISRAQSKALARLSDVVEVIPQPCGPRKLAQVFSRCLNRIGEVREDDNNRNPIQSAQTDGKQSKEQNTPDREDATEQMNSKLHQDKNNKRVRAETTTSPLPRGKEEQSRPKNDSRNNGQNNEKKEKMSGKAHVLLVDDNKINLNLLTMFMKKCGFSYEEAENGEEAVDTFKKSTIGDAEPGAAVKKHFDYILMDISMPVMNGIEATKRIRKLETEYKVPRTTVFALTGLASADARLDAMSAGVDLFLPKPVKFAELKTMIENN
ncbi:related to histidine kinase [Fusarium fujikuroi IMI 58289]|uniref:histidine kinase n=1 Tax=Gibberella fujikuroi (strain CBS 195.34 / IMI 58289 / NRRL A-6831) TaxID=1279085 RepID=S0EHP9_GIBF5|nr:related to histidine kinase [Fusarium fujikuroi IMI 58289]CCT73377.1 related to histidine kinase [Fusarium fujikuroi IMI 58289]